MFDPILSIAAVAFVVTPVILYFAILDRPGAPKSSPPKGNASFHARLGHK